MLDRTGRTAREERVLDALEAGIEAATPANVLAASISLDGATLRVVDDEYDLDAYERVIVLGGGNGAGRIAGYLADLLDERLTDGVVVTDDPVPAGPVEVVAGDHPIPSEANRDGAADLLELARDSGEETLALVAITGGGSALLPAPAGDISLSDLQTLTDELLRSGVPIDRINAVRKHVSELKGGRLARALAPADAAGLVFSDVSSEDPSVVASGPLSPDPTTYEDARAVLSGVAIEVPTAVERSLSAGAAGYRPETPTVDDPAFDNVTVHVLANGRTATSAALDVVEAAGFSTLLLSTSIRGEATEAAKTHVAVAEETRRSGDPIEPPAAIVSGGETTVTIDGDGTGGPNQEFALQAAIDLPDGVVLGAVDTDGIDGPTDAAGALVTGGTVTDATSARAALADNDAYDFLVRRDALLRPGQTGTNVNDLRVLLVPE